MKLNEIEFELLSACKFEFPPTIEESEKSWFALIWDKTPKNIKSIKTVLLNKINASQESEEAKEEVRIQLENYLIPIQSFDIRINFSPYFSLQKFYELIAYLKKEGEAMQPQVEKEVEEIDAEIEKLHGQEDKIQALKESKRQMIERVKRQMLVGGIYLEEFSQLYRTVVAEEMRKSEISSDEINAALSAPLSLEIMLAFESSDVRKVSRRLYDGQKLIKIAGSQEKRRLSPVEVSSIAEAKVSAVQRRLSQLLTPPTAHFQEFPLEISADKEIVSGDSQNNAAAEIARLQALLEQVQSEAAEARREVEEANRRAKEAEQQFASRPQVTQSASALTSMPLPPPPPPAPPSFSASGSFPPPPPPLPPGLFASLNQDPLAALKKSNAMMSSQAKGSAEEKDKGPSQGDLAAQAADQCKKLKKIPSKSEGAKDSEVDQANLAAAAAIQLGRLKRRTASTANDNSKAGASNSAEQVPEWVRNSPLNRRTASNTSSGSIISEDTPHASRLRSMTNIERPKISDNSTAFFETARSHVAGSVSAPGSKSSSPRRNEIGSTPVSPRQK